MRKIIASLFKFVGFGQIRTYVSILLIFVLCFGVYKTTVFLYEFSGRVCLAHPIVKKELKDFEVLKAEKKYVDSVFIIEAEQNRFLILKIQSDSLNYAQRTGLTQKTLAAVNSENKELKDKLNGLSDSSLCFEKYGIFNKKVRIVPCSASPK